MGTVVINGKAGSLNAVVAADIGDATTVGKALIKAANAAAAATAIGLGTGDTVTHLAVVSTNNATINGLTIGLGAGTTTGHTMMGIGVGEHNTTGVSITAFGYCALHNNYASNNNAFGDSALYLNASGYGNAAFGTSAGGACTSGHHNTYMGVYTGLNATEGHGNTFVGYGAGTGITTGGGNTIVGADMASLSSTLTNNVIVASGGTVRFQFDGTRWATAYPLDVTGGITGPHTKTLTDGAATKLFDVALADGGHACGQIMYSVQVAGTDGIQTYSGVVSYSANRRGTTYPTPVIVEAATLESPCLEAGTLTVAWTMTSGSGIASVLCNADTDRGTPVLSIVYTLISNTTSALTFA